MSEPGSSRRQSFAIDAGAEGQLELSWYQRLPALTPEQKEAIICPISATDKPTDGYNDGNGYEEPNEEANSEEANTTAEDSQLDLRQIRFYDTPDVLIKHRTPQTSLENWYLVSSHALIIASSVLKQVLHPGTIHAAETMVLGDKEVKIIALMDEEDPDAVEIILNVIHLHTDKVPMQIGFRTLRSLAIVCDKYQCGKALKHWVDKWMEQHVPKALHPGYEDWLFITHVINPSLNKTEELSKLLVGQASSLSVCKNYFMRQVKPGGEETQVVVDYWPSNILSKIYSKTCE